MNPIIGPFKRALFDSDMVMTRVLLACSELVWFGLLIYPSDAALFDRPTYKMMSHVMGQEAWAALFLITGVLQLTIVAQEDFHGQFARYFAAWNACLWVFVVGSCFLSISPPPAAMSGEIILAVVAFWVWLRPFIIREGILYARSRRV